MREADVEFQDRVIKSVELGKEDGFSVQDADGWWLSVRNPDGHPAPEPGSVARYYGRGFGYPVRGFEAVGIRYYYETVSEYQERTRQEARERAEDQEREWSSNWPETERRVKALPRVLRERMERFLSRDGWGAEFGFYELAVCETAARLVEHLGTAEAVREFNEKSYEEQNAEIEGIGEEHSGNSWGAAVRLAWLALEKPELVVKEHGAFCPLVGCREYGCWAADPRTGRNG